jgi:putative ABC transport system substrate-binding protein
MEVKPAVIVTSGGPLPIRAVRAVSSVVPVVFASGSDPVVDGIVESFNRPGGNTTGIHVVTASFGPKRLELLREIVPAARRIGFLVNSTSAIADTQIREMKGLAQASGVDLLVLLASTVEEIDKAFAQLVANRADALLMSADTYFQVRRDQLVALAARHGVPTMFEWPEFVEAGGLVSYSPSAEDAYGQMAAYVARVLNGARPADLPIFQPTRFELAVNLQTAKALGLTVPPAIVARADRVIE